MLHKNVPSDQRDWLEPTWRKFFSNSSYFRGDPRRASHLMMQVRDGMEWVKIAAKQKGIDFEMPRLSIDANGLPGAGLYHSELLNTVFACAPALERDSMVQRDKMFYLLDPHRDIRFHGTMDDRYFLAGIEEANHACYAAQHPGEPNAIGMKDVPADVYDAQQHEYEALLEQLRIAKKLGLPRDTTVVLEMRIEAAERVRRSMEAASVASAA